MKVTLSFLIPLVFLLGCPSGGKVKPPTDGPDPRYEFVVGVKTLQTPDRKTKQIDYEKALTHFATATQLKPDFANAHFNAGWTAETLGKYDEAAEFYRQAYKLTGSAESRDGLITALNKTQKYDEAADMLRKELEKKPRDSELRYSLVDTLTLAGKYEDAAQQVSEVLIYNKKDIQAYRLLSRTYYAQGKYEMSKITAEEANNIIMKDQPETLVDGSGAPINDENGQPKSGKVGDAGIWNNIGVTYLAMKDEPSALYSFLQATTADASHMQANMNLGFIYLKSGNHQKALERFETALKSDPKNLDAKIGKAVALRGTDRLSDAEAVYKELLKSNTKNPLVYINAATFYEKYASKKDYAKAKEILEQYRGLFPDDTSVFERIARVEESQRIEEERRIERERKAKEAKERQKRQEQAFVDLQQQAAKAKTDYAAIESCELAAEGLMEVSMYLEQVEGVINPVATDENGNFIDEYGELVTNDEGNPLSDSEKKDYVKEKKQEAVEMAGDLLTFVEEAQSKLDTLKETCAGAAPTDDGTETPPAE